MRRQVAEAEQSLPIVCAGRRGFESATSGEEKIMRAICYILLPEGWGMQPHIAALGLQPLIAAARHHD